MGAEIGRMYFVIARPGRSLKRLHRPNLLGLDSMGFKDKKAFQHLAGLQPCLPQRGPYEASGGILPGYGQRRELGVGKSPRWVENDHFSCYF